MNQYREQIDTIRQRLGMLVIPIDAQQHAAMKKTGRWYPVKTLYARCRELNQIPDWDTLEDFSETMREYSAMGLYYQTHEHPDGLLVRAI